MSGVMRRNRPLRSRLFSWFVGAILLAMATSSLVIFSTRPDQANPVEAVARNISTHLAAIWDDDDATRSYLAEIRRVTGFEARLVRGPNRLSRHVYRLAARGVAIAPDGMRVFLPVVRSGDVVGAVEIERFGPRPAPAAWWRFALALFLALAVLSAMAGGVAEQLARPLERLADAADRFGGGDLRARAQLAGPGRRGMTREVLHVALSFNRMADRVENMVRSQRELLGAISHELRSPLGRARVALEIARDRLAAEPAERSAAGPLNEVETQLVSIDSILGDLLDVTRAGLTDLRKQTLSLQAWLRPLLAREPSPPALDLVEDPAAGDLVLAFDAALLERAVHNLLENARAHGHPAELAIEVHVARVASSARVTVRDRGPGLPAGFAERAFEPFVRAETSRARPTEGAGHGLGLAIVRRVVEAHAGSVFARNAVGGGAEIGFDLPL
jgi:signal transduction histidine kinase